MSLSIVITAYNEEKVIGECLDSLKFADEIIVVADKCTDRTKEIALSHGAKVVEGKWDLEGPRRHAGLDIATCDFVMEVDADERVSPELAQEILDMISNPDNHYFWGIKIDNYVGGKLIRYGWGASWGTTRRYSLFPRGAKKWGDQRVHPKFECALKRRDLFHPIVHHIDDNISDMIDRLDRYTNANAIDIREKGTLPHFASTIRRAFTRFFKCYVQRKGYKEGYYGFISATFAFLYILFSDLKARLEP